MQVSEQVIIDVRENYELNLFFCSILRFLSFSTCQINRELKVDIASSKKKITKGTASIANPHLFLFRQFDLGKGHSEDQGQTSVWQSKAVVTLTVVHVNELTASSEITKKKYIL